MHIKKGDTVIVQSGKDKGTKAKVLKVLVASERVLVEGVNVYKKHVRKNRNTAGQIIDVTRSLHMSKVQPVDPKTGKGTRVGIKTVAGKRVRVAKKSGQEI